MLGEDVVQYLSKIGCCQRCILVYLGERSDLLYVNSGEIGKVIEKALISLGNEQQDAAFEEAKDTPLLEADGEVRKGKIAVLGVNLSNLG